MCVSLVFLPSAAAEKDAAEKKTAEKDKAVPPAAPQSEAKDSADARRAFNDGWSRGPSMGFESGLGGESLLPMTDEAGNPLTRWKPFQQDEVLSQEGSIVFENPMAGYQTAAPSPPTIAPWREWLLPGGVALAVSAVIAGGLIAWRMAWTRRAGR